MAALIVVGSASAAPPPAQDAQNAQRGQPSGATMDDRSVASSPASGTASGANGPQQGEVVGRVERIDRSGRMVVAGSEAEGLGFDKFKIDEGTQITVGGEKASITQLNEGDQVRASYAGPPNDLRVQQLEILPSTDASRMAAQPADDRGLGAGAGEPSARPMPRERAPQQQPPQQQSR